jgi:lysophospholipase L1-like esterase
MAKQITLGRKVLLSTVSIFIVLVVLLLIGEVGFRVKYYLEGVTFEKPEPAPPYNTAEKDSKLGWKPKANYLFEGVMQDLDKVEYKVHVSTNKNGFRQYGNPNSEKTKVFFIGDSYTQSVEVSDDKTFYKIIGDSLPIEVFAYGMAGYGQLQEYMILEEFLDEIKPDIVVLEVCSNDYIDNHYEMEMESGYKVGLRRPYLSKNGEISYLQPIATYEKVRAYSRFLGYLMKKWYNARQNIGLKDLAEKQTAEKGLKYDKFAYSVEITDLLLQKIANRLDKKTQLIVFDADNYNPQASTFQQLCEKNKIYYTENPVQGIRVMEHNSITIRAGDGYHWNEAGHQVIARGLMKDLRKFL